MASFLRKTTRISLLLISAVIATTIVEAAPRKWTDISGKFSVEAEYLQTKDGKVRLKKKDGKTISIPLSRLSRTDRLIVRDLEHPQTKQEERNSQLEPFKSKDQKSGSIRSKMNFSVRTADNVMRPAGDGGLKPPQIITIHDTPIGDISIEIADHERQKTMQVAEGQFSVEISKRHRRQDIALVVVNGDKVRKQTSSDRRRLERHKKKEDAQKLKNVCYSVTRSGTELTIVIHGAPEGEYQITIDNTSGFAVRAHTTDDKKYYLSASVIHGKIASVQMNSIRVPPRR